MDGPNRPAPVVLRDLRRLRRWGYRSVGLERSPGLARLARENAGCLHRLCRAPGHHFWPADIRILEVLQPDVIVTHAQVTDVYLLALAVQNRGRLATLDQRIPADAVRDGRKALELVTP